MLTLCSSLTGPGEGAGPALEADDVDGVLPFVPKEGEEVIVPAREGASYTGLKLAELDAGTVVSAVEKAIETGSARLLRVLLVSIVVDELERRFEHVLDLKRRAGSTVENAREYEEAGLGLQAWAHRGYVAARAEARARAPEGQQAAGAGR